MSPYPIKGGSAPTVGGGAELGLRKISPEVYSKETLKHES